MDLRHSVLLLLQQCSPRQLYIWVSRHVQSLRAVLRRRLLAAMLTAMMTTRLMLTQQLLSKVLLSWQMLLLAWHWLAGKVVTLMVLLLHGQLLGYYLLSGVVMVGLAGDMPVGVTPATTPCLGCVSISLMSLLPVIVTSLQRIWV